MTSPSDIPNVGVKATVMSTSARAMEELYSNDESMRAPTNGEVGIDVGSTGPAEALLPICRISAFLRSPTTGNLIDASTGTVITYETPALQLSAVTESVKALNRSSQLEVPKQPGTELTELTVEDEEKPGRTRNTVSYRSNGISDVNSTVISVSTSTIAGEY
eukprot:1778468-Rhodomonas_salina.1